MKYLLKYLIGFLFLSSCMTEHENVPIPYVIEVTGDDYEWHIRYPGLDGLLHTEDDFLGKQNIYLPLGIETRINLFSEDYLYFLTFPHFRQIGMAIPDQERSINFIPKEKGRFILKGNQMCAFTHENLIGELIICSPYTFSSWRNKNSKELNDSVTVSYRIPK